MIKASNIFLSALFIILIHCTLCFSQSIQNRQNLFYSGNDLTKVKFANANSDNSGSRDSGSIKYFPLSVGNKYIYIHEQATYPPGGTTRTIEISRISKDTLINNQRFFFCLNFPNFDSIWVRTDSVTGSLYKYDSSNSCQYSPYLKLIDSLSAKLYDTTRNCSNNQICTDTNFFSLFGALTKKKMFELNYYNPPIFISNSFRIYLKNFGIYSDGYSYSGHNGFSGSSAYTLKGCMINGIVYGDTTLTNIDPVFPGLANTFYLYPNYPNPFNPATTIKFEIPKSMFVKLAVYDILGREIELLVNEKLNDGRYSVEFSGENFPSGVYYYKLESDNFSDVKKMILLK